MSFSSARFLRVIPIFRVLALPLLAAILVNGPVDAFAAAPNDPASLVNPLIGTTNGGNDFPGAVMPFGMLAWSPEEPWLKGDRFRPAAPGGYEYSATKIRGFSLTHLMGTGCAGASGDIPFLPYTGSVTVSPSSDPGNDIYASNFSHQDEKAVAGFYMVKLANGVTVELTATPRTGAARFTYPTGKPALMLIRTSDSETGSTDARVTVDAASRTISGSVTSGNFCGYIEPIDRRSYYTLYFVAHFDAPFQTVGTWQDSAVRPGTSKASGGTTYGSGGFPPHGKGSGAWVVLDTSRSPVVSVRVGVSYVSQQNAEANLHAENPGGIAFDTLRAGAHSAWNEALGKIRIDGGTADERTVFYTALYHAMNGENLASDVNGQYFGMDGATHTVFAPQKAQYATFSGWDVYRSQLQLVALLEPGIASDIAQSLLNQADQNGGEWDRWTHNAGATHVMNGDPAAPAIADIAAFEDGRSDRSFGHGLGDGFDLASAYRSLLKAATQPTAHDLSNQGCPVECIGQRPSLDLWLKLHYIPTGANAWGPAADTLEDATADFAISQLARRLNDPKEESLFLERAQYWMNLFNPKATSEGGYIQNRNSDGTWPKFDPASDEGFVEGSAAQYLWMVPFNERGLFGLLGGNAAASARLDAFFHQQGGSAEGSWAVTRAGGLHAELSNEPSIETPWLYDFSGQPWKTEETVRHVLNSIWTNEPKGMPGNDDLGEMSAWYVWSAMGMYPEIPGRAELVLGSPLFSKIRIQRPSAGIVILGRGAASDAPYVQALKVNGKLRSKTWLPESFVKNGGTVDFTLASKPNKEWGTNPDDAPPSFAAPGKSTQGTSTPAN